MATVSSVSHESRNVLYEVPWRTYIELRENPENYHLRMTYDRGALEIMSPSARHEGYARYIDLVIVVWTEELGIPCRGLRQMTCKREDLAKGLEPDDCYYVQNEAKVRSKVEIDFAVDPPPDLAVEVEVSRSSVKKAPIYAALGVGELWRYDGKSLRIFELVGGQYQSREGSVCFPNFPVAKAEEVIRHIGDVDDTTFIRSFRRWVRNTFATGAKQE
jgi:Uma2 family endonuclease